MHSAISPEAVSSPLDPRSHGQRARHAGRDLWRLGTRRHGRDDLQLRDPDTDRSLAHEPRPGGHAEHRRPAHFRRGRLAGRACWPTASDALASCNSPSYGSLCSPFSADSPIPSGNCLITRGLQGLGFGGEWAVGSVLMGEAIRARYRGKAVGTVQAGWAVGWGVTAVCYTVLFSLLPAATAWRAMFWIGILPALLVFYIRRYRSRARGLPTHAHARSQPRRGQQLP